MAPYSLPTLVSPTAGHKRVRTVCGKLLGERSARVTSCNTVQPPSSASSCVSEYCESFSDTVAETMGLPPAMMVYSDVTGAHLYLRKGVGGALLCPLKNSNSGMSSTSCVSFTPKAFSASML